LSEPFLFFKARLSLFLTRSTFDGTRSVASRASRAKVLSASGEAFGKEGIRLLGYATGAIENQKPCIIILRGLAILAATTLYFLLAGCTVSPRVTQDSGIGQQLLFHSLERAVAGLDSSRFNADQVTVDVFSLSDDRTRSFVREFLIARLKERGFHIGRDGETVNMRFALFLSVFGLDEDETLVGLPAFVAPLMGVAVPELAPYKAAQNHGVAEVQLYAFDGKTGEFVGKTPVSIGRARYDQYKALIFANFTVSDIPREAGQRLSLGRHVCSLYPAQLFRCPFRKSLIHVEYG
jgi:hypothetical protein